MQKALHEIKTRDGLRGIISGHGPLSKNFMQVILQEQHYLVWASDKRYRMDDDENGKPILHPLDIVEIDGVPCNV